MDLGSFSLAIATFVFWGVSVFIAKLATNRIGSLSMFWDMCVGVFLVIFTFSFFVFKLKNLVLADKIGIGLAILAGTIGSLGSVFFYYLLTRTEVSRVAPLTSLYPLVTAILAIVFLHESITLVKLLGIIFSFAAIYLLSQ